MPLSAAPAAEGAAPAPADAAAAAPAPAPSPAAGKTKGKDKGKPAEPAPALPFAPTAGHSVTAYGGQLYVLGGHTKVWSQAAPGKHHVDPHALSLRVSCQGCPRRHAGQQDALQCDPAPGCPLCGHDADSELLTLCVQAKGPAAMNLRVIDLATRTVHVPEVKGTVPPARGGHTVRLEPCNGPRRAARQPVS